ncbi:MAG: hypothetical protein ACLUTA_16310 [Blautia wexlerae]
MTQSAGFSQAGAESDWRTANTESMKSTFSEENGYELIFDDAQQKQENQLTAIRNFIQQEVIHRTCSVTDRLMHSPGKAAESCTIVGRMVDVSDEPHCMGSDPQTWVKLWHGWMHIWKQRDVG